METGISHAWLVVLSLTHPCPLSKVGLDREEGELTESSETSSTFLCTDPRKLQGGVLPISVQRA